MTKQIDFPIMVNTAEAARALGRTTQTLRLWACKGTGPLQPIRVRQGGPLAWRGDDILRLLNDGDGSEEKKGNRS